MYIHTLIPSHNSFSLPKNTLSTCCEQDVSTIRSRIVIRRREITLDCQETNALILKRLSHAYNLASL